MIRRITYEGSTAALETLPGTKPRVLALLPDEPAGRISTRNAGAILFEANLERRPGDGIPSGPILGELVPGVRFYSLASTQAAASTAHRISCEIRALYHGPLAGALDAALRSVTTHAALTEAVLETRAVRLADPKVPPVALVEDIARQLWEAGLPVSFGPSWTPVPDIVDVSVGVQGLEPAFETFLQAHHTWQTLPR